MASDYVRRMDDNVSDDYRPEMQRRYAALAHRWHVLDDAAWRRAEYRVRAACVREAMQRTDDDRVLECCRVSLALCERVVAGDEPSGDEWDAARAAAWDAAWAAASVAAWAAARDAAWAAASAAAWDRLASATMDVIEAAVAALSAGEG